MIYRINPIQFILIILMISVLGIVFRTLIKDEAGNTLSLTTCETPAPLETQSFEERSGKDFLPPLCW